MTRAPALRWMVLILAGCGTAAAEPGPDDREAEAAIVRLGSEDPQLREDAERRLRELGASALPPLRRAMNATDKEVAARVRQLIPAIEIGVKLGPALLRGDPGIEMRLAAPGAAEWTRTFLDLSTPSRLQALRGRVAPWDLDPLVAQAFEHASSPEDRAQVCRRAGDWRLKSGAGPALALARSGSPAGKRAAMRTVAALDIAEAVELLPGLLEDPDPGVREAAVEAAGLLSARRLIPKLLSMLLEDVSPVAGAAGRALQDLQATEAVADLEQRAIPGRLASRIAAVEALAVLAPDRLIGLLPGWMDKDKDLASDGLRHLTKTPDASFQSLLKKTASDPELAPAAARCLGRLRIPGSVELLTGLLLAEDARVADAALEALGELKSSAALDAALKRLESRDPARRRTAAEYLCKLGRRAGGPVVLEFTEGWALLNALRRPEDYEKLRSLPLDQDLRGSFREICAQFQAATGVRMLVPPELLEDPLWALYRGRLRRSGFRGNAWIFLQEFSSSSPYELMLEADGIRVLPRAAAKLSWTAWLEKNH